MTKRFSLIAVLLLFFCAAAFADRADEAKLLKMIPADAEGVLSADVTDWLAHPVVQKELAGNPELVKFRAKLGVGPEDIGAVAAWGRGNDLALLLAWRKNVTPGQIFKAPDFTCRKVTVEGIDFHIVTTEKPVARPKGQRAKKTTFWVTQLPGNVFCFVKDAAAGLAAVKTMRNEKNGMAFPVEASGSLRGILRATRPGRPKGGLLSCRMVRGKTSLLEGFLSVTMNTPEEARQLSSQAMLTTNLVLASALQDDPDLAAELVRCLRFKASGPVCTLTVRIPGPLLERIGAFIGDAIQAQDMTAPAAGTGAQTPPPAAKPGQTPSAGAVGK